eukprot:TRINITY_DN2506_c0_g2_i1.p1 TRINITY_DN2506_c0_g2~~TRINITY_DN2506_c0_g2_i1.p1  ORF type:complete len:942 (+),score=205.36 TRINITY_DN2506_c0_g2_i1:76-2901(+)
MAAATEGESHPRNEDEQQEEVNQAEEQTVRAVHEADEMSPGVVPQENDVPPEGPEETSEPHPPKEHEEDAQADDRPKVAAETPFLVEDTTINVLPALDGKMLMSISDGGFQYLVAGARASTGVKAGRYMFEVTIVESKNPVESTRGPTPKHKHLLRVGFATAESSLFFGDGIGSAGFDSEGAFFGGDQRQKGPQKFGANQVIAIVLNLEPDSPNSNTLSLFLDGVRSCEPQALPEALIGKVLHPTVNYRNLTLHVNLGPQALKQLPFECRLVNDAAQADSEVRVALKSRKGTSEIVYPVGLPEEGAFDWLDQFLAENKHYTEISERSILEWARKSGVQRSKGYSAKSSNDKPGLEFGLPCLDDLSVNTVIAAVAPALERDFVVMELKDNLIADMRKVSLARFVGPEVRRVAKVIMGEPTDSYKEWVRDAVLVAKRKKVESDAKRKQAEKEKECARRKARKADEERKRKADAANKKDAKHDSCEAEKEEGAAEAADEKKDVEMEKEEVDVKPEEVFLTEDESKRWFRKQSTEDVNSKDLAAVFASFSLPEEAEGFDAVEYVWQPKEKCEDYLKSWVSVQKLTQKVEDLHPSAWFKEKLSEWIAAITSWKKKHAEAKDPARKKAALLAKRKKTEEAKKKAEKEEAEGDDNDKEEKEEEPALTDIDVEDVDVFAVDDVMDIGNGQPLFVNFSFEDWMLLSLRFEIHLLLHAFRHDVNDPERQSFGENHVNFYYNKYFKKALTIKNFGVEKLTQVLVMIKDTVDVDQHTHVLEVLFPDDTPFDNFVKLTEDDRRERLRRLDAGDESARLKFVKPVPPASATSTRPGSAQAGHGTAGPAVGGQKRPYPPGPPNTYGMQPKQQRGNPIPYSYGGIVHGAPPPHPGRGYGYGALPPAPGMRFGSTPPGPGYGSPYGAGVYGAPSPTYGAGVNARTRCSGYGDYGGRGL